jgi:O-antigen ligase
LSLCLLIAATQLVPLPVSTRAVLAPAHARVQESLVFEPTAGPLSLDPTATSWALLTGGSLLLVLITARTLFERQQGLRHVCRGVAWVGLILGAAAFFQRALTPALIYGIWRPPDLASNILPWGPFINRNDFAGWLLMAIPLTVGYLLMRIASRTATGHLRLDAGRIVDPRLIVLLASTCVMTGAVLASLSRSGILSLAIALAAFLVIARGRLGRRPATMLAAGVGVLLIAAGTYANLPALLTRLNEAWPSGLGGRLAVWRDTWPIVRDFPLTGVGVGAFERAMLVYQQSNRLMFFNHAHNEYLQIAAEGGVLLAMPAAVVLLLGTAMVAVNLRDDRSAAFWARAGAACGMLGVACQSVWDTPLRMPANAVLFAILAAIALHAPPGPSLPAGEDLAGAGDQPVEIQQRKK